MAGIYIHIPFCRQACNYCDFHFSTTLTHKAELVDAIIQEAELQKGYLQGKPISTIYFGGGTPSILTKSELESILSKLKSLFTVDEGVEVTLEANPDDLTPEKLTELKALGVNRLSIGIQSFIEQDLRSMNRAHNAQQAIECVKLAQAAGITNISIDLIYGIQMLDDLDWIENIDKAVKLGVQHISAYALTVEPKTALAHQIKTGKAAPVDEEKASRHFHLLVDRLAKSGFEQYEISNFSLPGHRSKHNSSYWNGEWYLGLGPSAHSFNNKSRQYNIRNNAVYISDINKGKITAEMETLSTNDRYNEYIMTALRKVEGIDLDEVEKRFGKFYQLLCMKEARNYIKDGQLSFNNNCLTLTTNGKFFADGIASSLFATDDV